MRADTNHPKFSEYIEKCREIAEKEDLELDQISPEECAHDGQSGIVRRKYADMYKELKQEYSFLFIAE